MVSADIAHHVFFAITIDICKLNLVWMSYTETLSDFIDVSILYDVTLAVEEHWMMFAVVVAANDIHVTVSIEIGVVDYIIFVTESFFEGSHVEEGTVSDAVLGPVRAATWVVAYHVGLLVSVHIDPLEVSTLTV